MSLYKCEYCSRVDMTLEEKEEHYKLHIKNGVLDLKSVIVPNEPDPMFVVNSCRINAIEFGQTLMNDFINENIAMGITSTGKTRAVGLKLKDISFWLQMGSLYEALEDIDEMIANKIDPELAPFITDERMEKFENKIKEYLSL